ncbi:hypothetical protein [Nonomuraea roseoviolacea]|uniref:Uncharacterized protein n=1 Tax=Nonomuraea roseoviolacea subsp. carminata TaxID=160689 RepID=A0ABT1K306_9ACTN|nr:hypothetical protein [Nonomuraea roseoviolacea]MCP2347871.1 hypothetical protein [Nonomuraea roseoviolacea subsp. carminata]
MNPQAVDWAAIPGPKWYRPEDIVKAFDDLLGSASSDRDEGYGIRSALGNDHAGTLYPAAVAGTDLLLEVIADHPGLPRRIALCVLLDWWGCFQPEPGFESYTGQEGETIDVIAAIVERVGRAAGTLRAIAERDPDTRGLIRELITAHSHGWTVADPTAHLLA